MNKKSFFLFTSIIFLLGGVILFAPSKTVLVIYNRKNPEQRVYSERGYRDGFVISYTHSVNKGRIHDFYTCDQKNDTLILQSMHFVSYGAGIPEPEEVPGATFIAMDDYYIISNINRVLPRLAMAVGLIADHSFIATNMNGNYENNFNDIEGEVFLKKYFAPQTSLIFEVKKVSPVSYWAHNID